MFFTKLFALAVAVFAAGQAAAAPGAWAARQDERTIKVRVPEPEPVPFFVVIEDTPVVKREPEPVPVINVFTSRVVKRAGGIAVEDAVKTNAEGIVVPFNSRVVKRAGGIAVEDAVKTNAEGIVVPFNS